jgi:hypothetical protein
VTHYYYIAYIAGIRHFRFSNKWFKGLSAIKALKPTSILKKAAQNKPPIRKKSARPTYHKAGCFSSDAVFKLLLSQTEKFSAIANFSCVSEEILHGDFIGHSRPG